jgi:DNA-directed RNA polymerase specialized sigma24 family protein
MSLSSSDPRVTRLADPALIASLSHFVRSRVPASEVDDIVQSALTEALAAERAPENADEVAAWVHGIARHKVVDWFRRSRREAPEDPFVTEAVAAVEAPPESARDLLRWAQDELPEGEENARTLGWLLREGEGEKLESIAVDEDVPAPRVRQRVARLRKHYRVRWAAQVAALTALLAIAVLLVFALRKKKEEIAPLPSPRAVPSAPQEPPTPAPTSVPEVPAASTPTPSPVPSAQPDAGLRKAAPKPTAVPRSEKRPRSFDSSDSPPPPAMSK